MPHTPFFTSSLPPCVVPSGGAWNTLRPIYLLINIDYPYEDRLTQTFQETPYGPGNSALKIKIVLESNPLKSRTLVRRLAVIWGNCSIIIIIIILTIIITTTIIINYCYYYVYCHYCYYYYYYHYYDY